MWLGLAVAGACALRGDPVGNLGLRAGRLGAGRIVVLVAGFALLSTAAHWTLVALSVRETGTLAHLDQVVASAQERSMLLALFALGIGPGVAEEVFFRGLVQGSLARVLPTALAVLGAAGVFGLAHGDPVQGPVTALLALYLGAVAAAARSIRPAMACHVTNNLLAVLSAPLGIGLASVGTPAILALVGASAGCLALGLRGLRRRTADR